jgi:hypothetical protein
MAQQKNSSITSVAIGCIGLIALAAVLSRVTYQWLEPTLPELRLGVAVASAICFALAISSAGSLLFGYGRGSRSRGGVLRRARSTETPEDGAATLATGVVRALTMPLTAPLSGKRCVSYVYRMCALVRGRGSQPNIVPVYWGYASRPFALDGPVRRVPVLAVPELKCPVSREESDDAVARAREYVRTTTFERTGTTPLGTLGAVFDQFRETLTDADGVVRRDWRRDGPDADPADLILEETILPIDVEASVHGPWSSSKGAIVAPGGLLAQTHVTAALGPPERQLDTLNVEHSTTAYIVTMILLAALGAGIIWFANLLPTLQ